ncbi:ribonuclease H-like domain-containing protein [Astrocystis sublimbata]|nr:ribonuclease H-like domain-containing protein [Astrocystis sublimbata]
MPIGFGEMESMDVRDKGNPSDGPPPPVFEYKMVDDLFYAAKKAPPESPASFWSHEQYRRMDADGESHKVKVHYCRSRHTMERVCKEYFLGEKLLGFDLEWVADSKRRDGVKKNVSLIQLASPSRIGLFHLALFAPNKDMVGPSFRTIMQDPEVTKCGVHIKGDSTRLRTHLNINAQGLIELSNLYKLVTYCRSGQYQNINRRLVPMATQVKEFLHLPLFKGSNVRSSNWSKPLAMDQVHYSAADAYAGLHLYATLDHHRKQLDPCPPMVHHAELNLAIPLAEGVRVASTNDAAETEDIAPTEDDILALQSLIIQGKEPVSSVAVPKETQTNLVPTPKPKSIKMIPRTPERSKKPSPASRATSTLDRPKNSRIEVADDRVASFRASHPQSRSIASHLRAYFLWHIYDLPPESVAQLLRDPPLKTITVVQYLLTVVQAEKLPVDHDRLRELADFIPASTLSTRWPVVAGMVTESTTGN